MPRNQILITPSAITPATGVEIAEVEGRSYLRLARRLTFPVARAIAAASPEYGWTWANRTALSAADETTTTAGVATMTHGATSTDWYSGSATYTAPFRYRVYNRQVGKNQVWIARLASNGDANYELCQLMVVADDDNSKYMRVGPGYASAISVMASSPAAFTTAGISSGQRDAGVWVMLVVEPNGDTTSFYSLVNQATPPATGWSVLRTHIALFVAGTKLKGGIVVPSGNASGTLVSESLYYDDYEAKGGPAEPAGEVWGATQHVTTNPEQAVIIDHELGGAAATVDQATLRLFLADIESRLPEDTGTVTWSCVRAAAGGASSSAYNAAAAVVIEGAGGFFNLWVKFGAGGSASASILIDPTMFPVG